MALLTIILTITVVLTIWWWLDPPAPRADTVIKVKAGRVELQRGHLRPPVLADVRALLEGVRVTRGHVALTGRRVTFSRSIPRRIHQQLRNVILNA